MIPFPINEREMRVLVLTPVGRDSSLVVEALADAGILAVVCDNMDDLRECCEAGAGAAVIAQEALTDQALGELHAIVRREPAWSDLPLILLTPSSHSRLVGRPVVASLQSFTNATLLERPLKVATLISAVQVALQSRRRQYEARAFIQEREAAIREREQLVAQMEAIIQNMTEGLTIADLDGNFLLLNDAQIRNIGFQGAGEYRRHISEIGEFYEVCDLEGNVLPLSGWPMSRVLAGETLRNYEVVIRRKGSADTFIGSFNGSLVRDHKGNVILAITTCRDIADIKRAETERDELLKKQQRIAETLQRSLLIAPASFDFPGLTISTQYASAWSDILVGGDFYDFFRVSDGEVAVLVGDVVGKGLTAAAHTAEVKFALRTILREHPDPAVALERLNSYMLDSQRLDKQSSDMLVAMSLAVIEPATGRVQVAVASSEAPAIVRKAGGVQPMEVGGLVLGAFPKVAYRKAEDELARGESLVMTTDGITEARQGKEFFGYGGLIEAIEIGRSAPTLDRLGESIIEKARAFAGGRLQDDACLLLVRRD